MTTDKHLILQRIAIVVLCLALAGLLGTLAYRYGTSTTGFPGLTSNTTSSEEEPEVESLAQGQDEEAIDWGTVLDRTAGHPDDPRLPTGELGASDKLLAAADPNDVADMLREPELRQFVQTHVKEPRYLFAIGRMAMAHGYAKLGSRWLQEAAAAGSVAAMAYLGYAAADSGDKAKAVQWLTKAVKSGFDSDDARTAIAEYSGGEQQPEPRGEDVYSVSKFARSEFVNAFISRDFASLKRNDWQSMAYAASVHETLWEGGDILFMTTPKILLELDPNVGSQVRYKMSSSTSIVGQQMGASVETSLAALNQFFRAFSDRSQDPLSAVVTATANSTREAGKLPVMLEQIRLQGAQDARRLAIGFEGNEQQFRRIYGGLRDYVLSQ